MTKIEAKTNNFGAIDASLTLHPAKARELVSEKDESRKATEDKDENELKGMKKKLAMRKMLKKTRKMLESVKTLSGEILGLRKHCVWI